MNGHVRAIVTSVCHKTLYGASEKGDRGRDSCDRSSRAIALALITVAMTALLAVAASSLAAPSQAQTGGKVGCTTRYKAADFSSVTTPRF